MNSFTNPPPILVFYFSEIEKMCEGTGAWRGIQ